MKKARPLSPHLTIYRPQITSTLSILHRITGMVLSAAYLFFVTWLLGLVFFPTIYLFMIEFTSSFLGKFFLLGISFAVFYHWLTGLRHLIWDAGFAFSKRAIHIGGVFVILFSGITTFFYWALF